MKRHEETLEIINQTKEILRNLFSKNIEDTGKVGEEETYLSGIAGAVCELDSSIVKLKKELNKKRKNEGRDKSRL